MKTPKLIIGSIVEIEYWKDGILNSAGFLRKAKYRVIAIPKVGKVKLTPVLDDKDLTSEELKSLHNNIKSIENTELFAFRVKIISNPAPFWQRVKIFLGKLVAWLPSFSPK